MLTDKCRNILLAIAGVVVCICDALRDKWVDRIVGWNQWHLVKWIAFYVPLIIIIMFVKPVKHDWLTVFVYTLFCWALWNIVYNWRWL